MTIDNPFLGNLPVREHKNFFGREDFVRSLFQSHINPETISNMAIIAELGHGKSSILNSLFFKENRDKYGFNEKSILVHINFENYVGSIEGFYELMYDNLYDSIKSNVYISDEIKNSIEEYTVEKRIKRELEKVLQRMAENKFKTVFLLDNLDQAAKKTDFTVEEFSFLRSLSSGDGKFNVQYIITATKDLLDISRAAEVSGFANIFVTIEVTAFDALFCKEEIKEYIKTLFERVDLEVDFDEYISLRKLSGGNPTILKYACNTLFNLKVSKEYKFDKDQFKEAVVKQCKNYFYLLWKNSSNFEKKAFYSIANAEDLDTDDYKVVDALRVSRNRAILKFDEDGNCCDFVSEAFKSFIMKIFESTTTKKMEDIEYSIGIINDIKVIMKEIGEYRSEISDEEFDKYVMLVGNKMDKTDCSILPKSLEGTILNNLWSLLSKEQRRNIITGEHLNRMFKDADTDLSLVSYLYCKSAEQVISDKILPLVKCINPDHIVDKNTKTTLRQVDNLMIGQVQFILSDIKFKPYIKNNFLSYGIDYSDFVGKVKKLRNVRNNSMHPGHIITRENLNSLRDYLFVEKNNIIEALFKITGTAIIN